MALDSTSPEVIVKGFKKCCASNALGMMCCGMALKRMGIVGVSVMKMKTMTDKTETATLKSEIECDLLCVLSV
jgi:hypothetical protein